MGYRPGSQTVHTVFPVFTHRVTAKVTCPVCGKQRTVSVTLEETQNPFNKNADGVPKSPAEIRENLRTKAKSWEPSESKKHHVKCWEQVHE